MTEERVPLKSKLWLAGADSLCATLSGIVTGGGLTYFFTRWMGLETNKAAVVWLLFGVWNAVNDPLFGYISDKTKSKLGRRKPYIRYGAPIYALVFIVCWVKFPFAGNQWAMFAQMLIMLFLFDTLYTAIATALYVMPFEIAVSNKARGSILLWKIVLSVFSLAIPLVLLPVIQPEPGESPLKFQFIMSAIGVLAGVIIFTSTFFYKEKGYIKEQKQPPFLRAIATCFKNKSFVIFEVLSFSVIYIQTSLMQGVLYYFAEFSVSMAVCYSALVAGVVSGIVLWLKKHTSWGIKKCSLILCMTFSISCLLMSFFGGHAIVAGICFFITGFGFSGGMFLVPLMNGDVIDYDESVTGLRREGMYAGINSLVTKPAISFANAAFIVIIKAFGYVQQAASGTQSEGAKSGILIAWMLIPALLLFFSYVSIIFYPLHGDKWQNTKLHLKQKHEENEREYLISLGQ
jgi:glycoside/pentoside/hexuronide:cation symporter, GPH family